MAGVGTGSLFFGDHPGGMAAARILGDQPPGDWHRDRGRRAFVTAIAGAVPPACPEI